jgi:Ca-activated chloride channel family protein
MFHFENLYVFVFLVVPLVFGGIYWATHFNLRYYRAQLAKFKQFARLVPAYAPQRRHLKFGLFTAALVFLIAAIANPRFGYSSQKITRQSVDVYLTIDVSRSMWAQDLSPNRMERARQFALTTLNSLRGERVGVITFAGEAYMQIPLTTDYAATEIQIRNASPAVEATQGTAIEAAIELVLRSQAQEKRPQPKAIIILTDGENHEETAVDKAKFARDNGINTIVVTFGTEAGAPIPLNSDTYTGFLLDKSGAVVQSKLNKALMQKIADAGNGAWLDFQTLGAQGVLDGLKSQLTKIDSAEYERYSFDDYDTYFYVLALVALVLLAAEFLIPYAKRNKDNVMMR